MINDDRLMKKARKYYNIEISKWGHKRKLIFFQDLVYNIFSFLSPTSKILEIGPGLGYFAEECKNKNYEYVAIEPSDKLSHLLEQRGHKIVKGSAPPIPFEDNEFDFVFANFVLEHQPTYIHAVEFISEIRRVLREEGYCCLSFPNWLKTKNIFHEMDYSHNFITTRQRVTQMANNTGFSIKEVYYSNGESKLRKGIYGWMWRIPFMIVQFIVNFNVVNVYAEYLNLGQIMWQVQKSVNEGIFMIMQKS